MKIAPIIGLCTVFLTGCNSSDKGGQPNPNAKNAVNSRTIQVNGQSIDIPGYYPAVGDTLAIQETDDRSYSINKDDSADYCRYQKNQAFYQIMERTENELVVYKINHSTELDRDNSTGDCPTSMGDNQVKLINLVQQSKGFQKMINEMASGKSNDCKGNFKITQDAGKTYLSFSCQEPNYKYEGKAEINAKVHILTDELPHEVSITSEQGNFTTSLKTINPETLLNQLPAGMKDEETLSKGYHFITGLRDALYGSHYKSSEDAASYLEYDFTDGKRISVMERYLSENCKFKIHNTNTSIDSALVATFDQDGNAVNPEIPIRGQIRVPEKDSRIEMLKGEISCAKKAGYGGQDEYAASLYSIYYNAETGGVSESKGHSELIKQ